MLQYHQQQREALLESSSPYLHEDLDVATFLHARVLDRSFASKNTDYRESIHSTTAMMSLRSTFLLTVLVIVLAAGPCSVVAERGVSVHEIGISDNVDLAEELPLSCGEPDAKQVPKEDKKDKDKHKKDKDKHKKKKKEEPKKKDKDSIASARSGRRAAVSARHSPKGNRFSAVPTNKTVTLDVDVRLFDALEMPAVDPESPLIGVASA
jgi:hypothetical protein